MAVSHVTVSQFGQVVRCANMTVYTMIRIKVDIFSHIGSPL